MKCNNNKSSQIILWQKYIKWWNLHSKTPHVVTVVWHHSDNVVTILSPASSISGGLQNHADLHFKGEGEESLSSSLPNLLLG